MDITWHGNTCYICREKGVAVVLNPDEKAGKLKGDIVLSSLGEKTVQVEGATQVFDWPGEYEMRDIPIIGFQAWKQSRKNEEEKGAKAEATILFRFEIGGIKVCHLGELGHTLTSDMVKELGDVDILMMAAGEGENLDNKKAMEILEAIDPRVLILMGNGNHSALLKELGADQVQELEKFSVKSKAELPDDKRIYVVLKQS
jgi:L-ascorbate metabolism protein UlaG (beta-lactamase superfamily)